MQEDDFPALYKSANALSGRAQATFFGVLGSHLVLLVVAAILSVINLPVWQAAYLQALVMIAALGCTIFLFTIRPDKSWYAARALAESIKTMTWRYTCRAEPFHIGDDGARALFAQKLKSALKQNIDLAGKLTEHLEADQITAAMEIGRSGDLEARKLSYRDNRIVDQLKWYSGKSKTNGIVAFWCFCALIALNFTAIVFALGKIQWPTVSIWPTDIFIAAGACLLTWMQAKRFSELSASYALAANEISLIRLESLRPQTDEMFSEFVGDAENAFSREHTQWVARKDV
ncbi:MAG: DUF4231 domain-containing protein [Burkholderiaceae bacterium]|nr:DUF4231 domain-containing protein [Burkholderiaceae bacterium]